MIIGTAGHIDHGKTALVKALTGIDADRLKEEKARGITIDLGYAYTPLANGEVLGFIDVPGHEKLVHNMLAGATGIDFALLVIAADDGPMPQTREHLAILELLGLERGAVALTKIDRVIPERLAEARAEIQALLAGRALADSPIFELSSVSGQGVPELRAYLEKMAAGLLLRPDTGHFRLAVDRVFTLTGTGVVVTGTAFSGAVKAGDKLLVSPNGIAVRVRGLHVQNRPAASGRAGQRCALNLVGTPFEKRDVQRGDWILDETVHAPTQRFDAHCTLLDTEQKALKHWMPVHLHIGTSDISARIAVLEGDAIAPGGTALVQIITDKPVCALNGDRFILRDQSATRTLGGGVVLDPFPPVRNRRAPARLALLRAMRETDPEKALAFTLEHSASGADLTRFAQSRNMRHQDAQALWRQVPMQVVATATSALGFSPARWREMQQTILDRLAMEHQQAPDALGPDHGRLQRMALPTLTRPAFSAVLDALLSDAKIAQSGPWLHLPEHKVTLSPAEEKLWQSILPLLLNQPFQPPRVRDIARALALNEQHTRLLLRRVARIGEVYLVAHDHYFAKEAVNELCAIVQALAENHRSVHAAEFRDQIGTGRKLAIQILEFFDRIGYTRRAGDAHQLRQESALQGDEPL